MMMTAVPNSRLRLGHELQDLRLDGHVQRGRRLVGEEEPGIAGERHGDHDALAHAAGELVRVVLDARGGGRNADHLQQLDGALRGGAPVHVHVELERLGDLAADGEHGIEGGHRLLEDHGDAVAADVADLVLVDLEEVFALEPDFAVDDAAGRRRDEAQEGEGGDALAAAALADEADGLALVEVVADAVDRLDDAVVSEEVRLQVLSPQAELPLEVISAP